MKKGRQSSTGKHDRRDGLRRASETRGPHLQPYHRLLIGLVPDLETWPDWQDSIALPYYQMWADSPEDSERVRGAIAAKVIQRLRHEDGRAGIVAGDPRWLGLALRVVAARDYWHQSGRIQASVLRSLTQRLLSDGASEEERRRLRGVIADALLWKVDTGAGEEFRALTRIARNVASDALIAGLETRIGEAPSRSVRINAARMLDCMRGKPYRRYGY